MENINQVAAQCPCRDSYAQRSLKASETQVAAINSSQSLDLDILTEEGDKVTLSMDAKASALYASYAQVEVDDDGFSAKQGEVSAGSFEREISFSVEGNLNADERREIRKVIKTVNRMMRNFVNGKVKPMMAKAGKLAGLETIDSLELSMEYERNVVVARQTQATVGYNRYGAAKEAPAAIAPKEAPAAVAPAANTAPKAESTPTPRPVSNINVSRMSLEAESKSLALEMSREVVAAKAPQVNVLEGIDRMLNAYRNMAMKWNPLGANIMDHVRELFDASMSRTEQFGSFDMAISNETED